MSKLLLALGGILAVLLLASVITSAAQGWSGPSAADLARDSAEAARIARDAELEATWAPVRAAVVNLALIAVIVGGLAYLASLGVAHVIRFRRERQPDARGLLPVELEQLPSVGAAALGAYHTARIAEAQRQPVPHTLSFAPHTTHAPRLDYRGDNRGDADAPAALAAPVNVPSFGELLTAGRIGRGQPLLLGLDVATGEGAWGDWKDLYSAGLGGKQGSGKSWTAASLISQSLLGGARVVLADPHAGDAESLVTRLEPLLPFAELVAEDDRATLEAARYVHDEFQRRKAAAKARQSYDSRPMVLVIDEWTSLLRGEAADELPPLLAALTTEGRKYGCNALLLAQRWEAAAAGGSDVRNTLTAHYVHRMRGDEARMMTGLRASALPDDTLALQPGQAYLFDTKGNIRKVATPLMNAADLARVAQLLGGAAPDAAPPRPTMGFRPSGAPGGAPGGAKDEPHRAHPDAPKLTPEEARIVAAFLGGKSASELAAELNGGKRSGDGFNQAARRVADILRKALGGAA